MEKEQLGDSSLADIFDNLKTSKEFQNYFIHESDGLLYHSEMIDDIKTIQLVVPSTRQLHVLQLAHDSEWHGHMGSAKTLGRIKATFYWPKVRARVVEYCAACTNCQLRKRQTVFDRIPIEPVLREAIPFKQVCIDCIGPLNCKSSKNFDYVLLLVDSFSKYVDAVPLKKLTAVATCDALLQMFSRTAIPSTIVSDNAPNFNCLLMKQFEQRIGASPKFSTPYHAQGNGLCERMIQNFKNCLHHIIVKHGNKWHEFVPFVLWGLRDMANSTTHLSPNMLLYGRKLPGPLDILKNFWTGENTISVGPTTVSKYLNQLKERLAVIADMAESHAAVEQEAYKSKYNKRAKAKKFVAEDKVLCFVKDQTHSKILSRWVGPCEIVNQVSQNSYFVKLPNNSKRVLHANDLRKFIDNAQYVGLVNNQVTNAMKNQAGLVKSAQARLVAVINENDAEFGEVCEVPLAGKEDEINFEELIDTQCSNLHPNQRKQLTELLYEFADIFSSNPGCCDTKFGEHSIRVDKDTAVPRR